jgi:phage repressor protein C with HTH and peptisase S24 domain
MAPTLVDGDEILVENLESSERVRDGIYVLRQEDALLVKRLAMGPSTRSVRIRSDNPAYPEWPECDLASLQIIGRVIWAGHRVS